MFKGKLCYEVSYRYNAVFSGPGRRNPIPRLTCCDSEIWLNLRQ